GEISHPSWPAMDRLGGDGGHGGGRNCDGRDCHRLTDAAFRNSDASGGGDAGARIGAYPTEVEQHRRSDEETRRQRGASLEPKRVMSVITMREVLEVYHAHPPVGRFPFRRLVGVYGSGAFHDQDEQYAKSIPRLNAPHPSSVHCPNRDIGVFV